MIPCTIHHNYFAYRYLRFNTHEEGSWSLKKENAERASRNFETKEEALDDAREFMKEREVTLKIFKKDGSIQEERTYPRAKDPERTPG